MTDGSSPRLLAVSDLHVGYEANRAWLGALPAQPQDWLIVAGDVCEKVEQLKQTWQVLRSKFAKIIWTPGNHELWTTEEHGKRGEAKYLELVEACREFGVLTPEDPYLLWEGQGGPCFIAPTFVLYDYSFCPSGVTDPLAWALEAGVMCADEKLLWPDPYASRQAWCQARVAATEPKLAEAAKLHPLVIVNHFPLRYDQVRLPLIPRFSIWCGSRLTHDWHQRYRAKVVVSGHLHVRSTDMVDNTRFEEVSLGYPRQWSSARGAGAYIREILPGPEEPVRGFRY